MNFVPTELPEVIVVEPKVFGDSRGFFMEVFHAARFAEARLPTVWKQDNISRSQKNVLRGLHFQLIQPQGKLVRCLRGAIYDVAVDVRRSSPTFGKWVGVEISEENRKAIYVPVGFAHGFCVLSEEADFFYKCTDYYHPASECGIAWDDPAIGIDWPLREVSLSAKDRENPRLAAQLPEKLPVYEG